MDNPKKFSSPQRKEHMREYYHANRERVLTNRKAARAKVIARKVFYCQKHGKAFSDEYFFNRHLTGKFHNSK